MSSEERPETAEVVNETVDTAAEDISANETAENPVAETTEAEPVAEPVAEVAEAPVEEAPKAPEKEMSFMEKALQDMVEIRVGKILECKVIEVKDDGLVVYCGQKKDGFVSAEEIGSDQKPEDFKKGQTFKAKLIENKTDKKEFLLLSKKQLDEEKAAKIAREEAEKEMLAGDFDVEVIKVVTGGLLAVKGDYTVFIPNSHIDVNPVEEDAKAAFVGQTVKVRKLPDKKDEKSTGRKKIVASRKQVIIAQRKADAIARKKAREERIEREEQEKKDIFNANIDRFKVNHIVPGVVKKFVGFGAFVNVYGFHCLAPTNEISWIRDTDPSQVLELNKEYDFLIIKVDPENYKVTLSYKQIQKKPYELAAEKYPVGTIIKGTVQSIVKFGAFVSIEPGIDGLVHISNISYDKIEDVASVLTVGQEIEAKVISFAESRIALSIKDLLPVPTGVAEKRERRQFGAGKPKTERTPGDKKSKKNEDAYESPEEKANYASYGGSSAASNLAFSDLFKGLHIDEDEGDSDK